MGEKVVKDADRMHFSLHGPKEPRDLRVTPYRDDLADIELVGDMFAPHYAVSIPMRCVVPSSMLRKQGGLKYQAVSQLLHGEKFHVLDIAGEWSWGYCEHDKYVGHIRTDALAPVEEIAEPTHEVTARGALIFAEPDIKSPNTARLPMGAKLNCGDPSPKGDFLATGHGGYVHTRYVDPLDRSHVSFVELAEGLVGAPYIWGGRSGDGLDCSGLLQMVLGLTGISAPRDTDQQMEALGTVVQDDDPIERGDLIFFDEHVGIMTNSKNIVHANSHWMQVVVEPLDDVVARFGDDHPLLARKRL